MSLKTRFSVTVIILSIWWGLVSFNTLVESPLKGNVSASQLDDTTSSYVTNKLVSGNIFTNVVGVVATISIVLLWVEVRKNK